jgi:MoaA/NifB/PqqE/SkfB family radical SAM enzyme
LTRPDLLARARRWLSRLRDRRASRVAPLHIRVEASSFCQLRCPSCPTTSGAIHPAVSSGYLRLADFQALIDQSPSIASVELSNYGEALLNPQLIDILQYAREKSVAITLGNGVNLNHCQEELIEAPGEISGARHHLLD